MSMTIELLIFDCDGVLLDSEPAAIGALTKALQRVGVDLSYEEVYRRFVGLSEQEALRLCTGELGIHTPQLVFADSRAALFDEFSRVLQPMEGMPALVKSLPHRKCVASNSTMERLRRSLGLFDLWKAFDPHIFGADMVERPKPAPDLFLLCAERLGVDPARCVVIDDNVHGIAGAIAAGMRAIGFVDPADPRGGRHAALVSAGAALVAEGARQLARVIDELSAIANPEAPSANQAIVAHGR